MGSSVEELDYPNGMDTVTVSRALSVPGLRVCRPSTAMPLILSLLETGYSYWAAMAKQVDLW